MRKDMLLQQDKAIRGVIKNVISLENEDVPHKHIPKRRTAFSTIF